MKIYILLALFLALSFSKPLNPKKIIYALNAGGNQNSKSALGFTYFSVKIKLFYFKNNIFTERILSF